MALLQTDEYKVCAGNLIEKQLGQKLDIRQVDFALKERLEQRLQQIRQAEMTRATSRTSSFGRLLMAAACLILAFTGSLYLFLSTAQKSKSASVAEAASRVPNAAYTRYLSLPDGSSVVLHAGSKLLYPSEFGKDTREVTLQGEAYFDITHNVSKPFIIHTGKVKTTVLGTAFNIKADDKQVVVSVTRGAVKVENELNVLAVLTPNQQVLYSVPEAKTDRQTVDAVHIVTDWTKEDMVFNGISFEDIAGLLSKRYATPIIFKNEGLKKCKIRASFSGTEKLEQVCNVLCGIRNGNFRQLADGTIELDGESCD